MHWYGHLLRREDGDSLRMVFHFVVEDQSRKGRALRTGKLQVVKECVIACLMRESGFHWSRNGLKS